MNQAGACGSWPSPITSEAVTRGALRLSQPRIEEDWLYWLEGRPDEGGRQVVVRVALDAAVPAGSANSGDGAALEVEEISPSSVNVRTRVHEYGGGEFTVHRRALYYVDDRDQQIYRVELVGDRRPQAVSATAARYADLSVSPDGGWLVAVEEAPRAGDEPVNRVVAFDLAASAATSREPVAVGEGFDFVSFPRFAPDGSRLVFTAWNHPAMPWDESRLLSVRWSEKGPAGPPAQVAGSKDESIFQPRFSPGGVLHWVSDRSGWWNLVREGKGGAVDLHPAELEFGRAQWVFNMSTYDFVSEEEILCSYTERGVDRLTLLDAATGALRDFDLPLTSFGGVGARGQTGCFLGAGPTAVSSIFVLDLASGALRSVRPSSSLSLADPDLSPPEAIEFPSAGGRRAYAFYYPPKHATARVPDDELPPLLVKSHGGPTSATAPALDLRIQYWTSRGFAVVDVNYAGSSGYGRRYRDALRGQWGVADVEDCVAAAQYLVGQGLADPSRLAISGGSAGGYTTLCALTFHDCFAAGASHYGIGDLEALLRDTHKFESRYLDGLIAPYDGNEDLYRSRSPIHFTERLSCPVIFFQGLEDRVVPPNQAEAMVAALAARGIPHAYVTFEGEQHGFRRAENIRTALDGELYFYSEIFGFEVERHPPQVQIQRRSR